MKEKLINFIKDFENSLAKDFNNKWEDIGYYNYCLGLKATCLNAKTIINNTDIKDLKIVLNKEKDKIDRNSYSGIEKQYYCGLYNMYDYILREVE